MDRFAMQDAGRKISAGKLLLSKNRIQIVSIRWEKKIVRNILPSMHIYCKRKEGGLEKLAVREIPPHRRIWKRFKRTPGIIFAYILHRARFPSPSPSLRFQCAFSLRRKLLSRPMYVSFYHSFKLLIFSPHSFRNGLSFFIYNLFFSL